MPNSTLKQLNGKTTMRILVCGDRNWKNKELIEKVLLNIVQSKNESFLIIHGACRGADQLAGEVAEKLNINILEFPAQWNKYGNAAGPIRNQKMLDEEKPDLVIAFHNNISQSKGTGDMIKRSKMANIPIKVFTDII